MEWLGSSQTDACGFWNYIGESATDRRAALLCHRLDTPQTMNHRRWSTRSLSQHIASNRSESGVVWSDAECGGHINTLMSARVLAIGDTHARQLTYAWQPATCHPRRGPIRSHDCTHTCATWVEESSTFACSLLGSSGRCPGPGIACGSRPFAEHGESCCKSKPEPTEGLKLCGKESCAHEWSPYTSTSTPPTRMPWLAWSGKAGEARSKACGCTVRTAERGVTAYAVVQEPLRRLSSWLDAPRRPLEAWPMGGARGGSVALKHDTLSHSALHGHHLSQTSNAIIGAKDESSSRRVAVV